MIRGIVTPRREAVIRLMVGSDDSERTEVEFVVDTGFNGFMTLPPAWVSQFDLVHGGFSPATLADGQKVFLPLYEANVVWDQRERSVGVLETDGGPLIGMALLEGFNLNIPVVEGGVVTIEPLKNSGKSL